MVNRKKGNNLMVLFLLISVLTKGQDRFNIPYTGTFKDSIFRVSDDLDAIYLKPSPAGRWVENDFDGSAWWIRARINGADQKIRLGRIRHPGLYVVKVIDTTTRRGLRDTVSRFFFAFDSRDASAVKSPLYFPDKSADTAQIQMRNQFSATLNNIGAATLFAKDSLKSEMQKFATQLETQLDTLQVVQFTATFMATGPALVLATDGKPMDPQYHVVGADSALKFLDVIVTKVVDFYSKYVKDTTVLANGTQQINFLLPNAANELATMRLWYNGNTPCPPVTHNYLQCLNADFNVDDLARFYTDQPDSKKSLISLSMQKDYFQKLVLIGRIYGRKRN